VCQESAKLSIWSQMWYHLNEEIKMTEPTLISVDVTLEDDVYLASPYDDNDPEVDTDDGTETL
jgi:hypothetical protein